MKEDGLLVVERERERERERDFGEVVCVRVCVSIHYFLAVL
jgi:hypothetical protein